MIEQTGTVLAAAEMANSGLAIFGAALACGLIIVGAAGGIGLIGAMAVKSIARQPEAGGNIFRAMVIAAAFVEGVTFFALLICFFILFWLRG